MAKNSDVTTPATKDGVEHLHAKKIRATWSTKGWLHEAVRLEMQLHDSWLVLNCMG